MRRPRNNLPIELKHLTFNVSSQRYEGTEKGITYKLTYEQLNHLKRFYKGSGYLATLSKWYDSLTKLEKKEVIREGIEPPANDFYPDVEYD